MTTIDRAAGMALVLPPIRDEFELVSVVEPAMFQAAPSVIPEFSVTVAFCPVKVRAPS